MRHSFLLALLLICCISSFSSFAQLTAFTAKVVDEQNVPVAGATVKIYKAGKILALTANKDGVFYTPSIMVGDYFMDLNANGRLIRAKKIFIQPDAPYKIYYNLKLYSKGVVVSLMHQTRQFAGSIR